MQTVGASHAELRPFRPAPWLPGAHLQTIVPSFWPLPKMVRPHDALEVTVEMGTAVRVFIHRPEKLHGGTLLLIHGMGGSAESGYMRRTANLALERGWVAVRMNLRNCGGTEELSRTLYNAGQSGDVAAVLTALASDGLPRPYAVAGFSLGGNIALRYGGVTGPDCQADAVAGVNPPVDLDACATAIEQPRNSLYQRHYVSTLCKQLRLVAETRRVDWQPPTPRSAGSIRRIDDRYTAPDGGYPDAAAYYRDASSGPRLPGLRRPALILSARDDPFVEPHVLERYTAGPWIQLAMPERGGHCGYWRHGRRPFWAAEALLDFFEGVTRGLPRRAV